MIGIMFIVAGIAILSIAYCIYVLNKKVKKLETEIKKISNPHNLNL